ncbi:winged helix-turn-helix domain-containing protein [Vibrio breoganii]|uniref:winged helix-turn-helix domain-containing protein n=1 Tax=Vibrio breoganii TaxID=553239 RepID=UPI0011132121|nr:winged helix-turn-helix domain-containing protein [Vibrio breoganii]
MAGLLVWNFKIVMLVFSSASYAVTVWEIDHFYSQTFFIAEALGGENWVWSNYIFCIYVMPLLTAIFYIYVFPFFSHKVFEHSYDKQIKLNNKRKTMQGTAILTEEEKEEILNEVEQAKLKSRKDVLDARNEIADLESQRDTLITEKGQLESTLEDAADEKAALVTKVQTLTEQLAFYQARYENDDEATAERMAAGKEAIVKMREQFSSTASPSNDETADEGSKDEGLVKDTAYGDMTFYHKADAKAQEVYLSILSALFIRNEKFGGFALSRLIFNRYMPDLMLNKLVEEKNGDYALTEKGRDFFGQIKEIA